jgi:predicted DsbA family dithiol-disulfide isomerase
MGVAMVLPKISPQPYSHLAFERYQHALEHGKANEYNFRVFEAFFQEERDIGEVDVLSKLAADVDLDSDSFQKDLETRKYQEVHQQALQHAYHEARISGVPTFHIGELVLSGLQSKENLEKAITLQIKKL